MAVESYPIGVVRRVPVEIFDNNQAAVDFAKAGLKPGQIGEVWFDEVPTVVKSAVGKTILDVPDNVILKQRPKQPPTP